jgi:hypothetical protein
LYHGLTLLHSCHVLTNCHRARNSPSIKKASWITTQKDIGLKVEELIQQQTHTGGQVSAMVMPLRSKNGQHCGQLRPPEESRLKVAGLRGRGTDRSLKETTQICLAYIHTLHPIYMLLSTMPRGNGGCHPVAHPEEEINDEGRPALL